MDELLGQVANRVAVVALSPLGIPYVPFKDAVLFSLYPDYGLGGSNDGGSKPVYRIARIRLWHNRDSGLLCGKCNRWWDLANLLSSGPPKSNGARAAIHAADLLNNALVRSPLSALGVDLPIYLDKSVSPRFSAEWNILEWDVFRGLNGTIPFHWTLPAEDEELIKRQLPFLDVAEHFRSVVSRGEIVTDLITQLVDQYTPDVTGMSLMPFRWVNRSHPDDVIVVKTNEVRVMTFADPRKYTVDIGSLRVPLSRPMRARGAGAPASRKESFATGKTPVAKGGTSRAGSTRASGR